MSNRVGHSDQAGVWQAKLTGKVVSPPQGLMALDKERVKALQSSLGKLIQVLYTYN